MHARPARPLDFYGTRDASHPIPLRPAAYINQAGTGGVLQNFVGLKRRQGALVRKIGVKGTLLRQCQNAADFAHGVEKPRITSFRV